MNESVNPKTAKAKARPVKNAKKVASTAVEKAKAVASAAKKKVTAKAKVAEIVVVETRQMRRAKMRRELAIQDTVRRAEARKQARRNLLKRQSRREKEGFYTGRSTTASMSPSRSRLNSTVILKHTPYGRFLRPGFHATKGYRADPTAMRPLLPRETAELARAEAEIRAAIG